MGLPIPSLRLIIREHKIEPFKGRVLTLGRMAVLATYEEVQDFFKEEGVEYCRLDEGMDKLTNIPEMRKGPGIESKFTSDVVFFSLLGVENLETIDLTPEN